MQKFFTTLDLGSAFWQVPLRKQDRDKTGFACELGLFQSKRMPFGLCNATATFQRLMAHALIGVTKKYGNLVMCYVDDVVIVTSTLEDHIERLDEVFACMKRSGLKCKPSKCEILKDSIKYLGRMVDRHGIRPDPDAVEAVLTWKSPKNGTPIDELPGFCKLLQRIHQRLCRQGLPDATVNETQGQEVHVEQRSRRVIPENKKRVVRGTSTRDANRERDVRAEYGCVRSSDFWNSPSGTRVERENSLETNSVREQSLKFTEMKYGAPKAEMFAVVTFVEKYRAYLGSEPFKLRVDNRALSWLKTYSMDQSYIGRWIVHLDGYNMIIEHRTRDKHQNADSLSKKTEFYERQEQREADRPEIKDGFSFMDKETYDSLPLTRWLDKSGKPIEDHTELPKEPPEKTILKKNRGMPIGIMLKSKIVREALKAKGYDLNQVETGEAQIDDDLMSLLEKLADDKPVIQEKGKEEPEVTILRKSGIVSDENTTKVTYPDGKQVVQSLVEKIPDDILEQPRVRKKKVAFKEEAEYLGLGQESGEWSTSTEEEDTEGGNLSGECEKWDEDSDESSDNQDSLCMMWQKRRLDTATGNYKQIHPHERTTWTYRKYEEVKNLKELQFRGKHSGNYHATQMTEQIWCQKMI